MSKICVIGLGGYSVFLNVDHFNARGETVKADNMFVEAGGKGYNQAVATARLGAQTTFIGAFGNDSEGKFCIDFLKSEGIEAVPFYKDIPTAYACIVTDTHGENRVTVFGGAAAKLSVSDVEQCESIIAEADALVLQNEIPEATNLAAIRLAKKHGVKVVFNPAPAAKFSSNILSFADVITPNEQEVVDLFGTDYIKRIQGSGMKAVVTLGGDGCAVITDTEVQKIPAIPTVVTDTTGAGDCFNGALAVGLAEGMKLKGAASFATKVSSVAVSKRGAVGSMPHRNEI